MRFHAKKVYGQSMLPHCTFCGRTATQKTKAGLEVCYQHINENLAEIKCACGNMLEQRSGKFGPYFNCIRCGNINFKKAMEINSMMASKEKAKAQPFLEKKTPTETIITSRDVEYFD